MFPEVAAPRRQISHNGLPLRLKLVPSSEKSPIQKRKHAVRQIHLVSDRTVLRKAASGKWQCERASSASIDRKISPLIRSSSRRMCPPRKNDHHICAGKASHRRSEHERFWSGGLCFALGKHRFPARDAGFIKVKQARNVLDAEAFGQQKQGVGHTRLNDLGLLCIQRLQERFTVDVRKVHWKGASLLNGSALSHVDLERATPPHHRPARRSPVTQCTPAIRPVR